MPSGAAAGRDQAATPLGQAAGVRPARRQAHRVPVLDEVAGGRGGTRAGLDRRARRREGGPGGQQSGHSRDGAERAEHGAGPVVPRGKDGREPDRRRRGAERGAVPAGRSARRDARTARPDGRRPDGRRLQERRRQQQGPCHGSGVRSLGDPHVADARGVEQLGEQRGAGDPADQQHERRGVRTGGRDGRDHGVHDRGQRPGERTAQIGGVHGGGRVPARTSGSSDSASRTRRVSPGTAFTPATRQHGARLGVEPGPTHREAPHRGDPAAAHRRDLRAAVADVRHDRGYRRARRPAATPDGPGCSGRRARPRGARAPPPLRARPGPRAPGARRPPVGAPRRRCTTTSSSTGPSNSPASADDGLTADDGNSATSRPSAATRVHALPTCTATRVTTSDPRRRRRGSGSGGSQPSWTRRLPRRRSTSVPRPGGKGWGFTPPTSAPSSGLPFITRPGAASSRRRPSSGSNSARPAPPLRRATTTCSPTSLACARNSTSGSSGFVAWIPQAPRGRSRRRARTPRARSTSCVPAARGPHPRPRQPAPQRRRHVARRLRRGVGRARVADQVRVAERAPSRPRR